MPGWFRLLARLNALPIGTHRVRVGDDWLVADSLDRLAASLGWKLGWLEGRERRFIARTVGPGMIVVDVGANLGFHTLTLARAVGPSGRVYAIEPDPRNHRALQRAIELAGVRHVSVLPVAACDRSGPMWLDLSPINRGDHRIDSPDPSRQRIAVTAAVLDDLLAQEPKVDFVKIDVQGVEPLVLRGLERTLGRCPGLVVLCELSPRQLERTGASFDSFFAPLRSAGLVAHLVDRQGEATEVDPEKAWSQAERRGHLNVVFARR